LSTPRPLYLFIGTVLATLVAIALGLIFLSIVTLNVGDHLFVGEVWAVPLLVPFAVGGVTTMVGMPIAMLVHALAPRSVAINLLGVVLFVAIAPLFFGSPFTFDESWIELRIGFGLFGALAIALALSIGRLTAWRIAKAPVDLTDTFG
jgi:hypothetical protein